MTVSSPCIRICILDEGTGLCVGCGRTAAEIGGWLAMGEEARRRIMAELDARLARMTSSPPPDGSAARERAK